MLGRTAGAVLVGVDAHVVDVEADLTGGLPSVAAVGLPDSAVREGLDRLRAALRHAGFEVPQRRLVINLAPAELRKQGAGLDLPIAAAVLVANAQLPAEPFRDALLMGELGLDGTVRPIRGALAGAVAASAAGRRRLIVPHANADEAALVDGADVFPVRSLADLSSLGRGEVAVHRIDREQALARAEADGGAAASDLADVAGQAVARRALEIAAAGGHHLLFQGPPGSGKSLLARRLPGILPPLELGEALEVTRVRSAAGEARGLRTARPFRAPHHGVSAAGLIGGGRPLRPGEISLAHHGVLFLDELAEFRRDALEALRQPLEDGVIHLRRVEGTLALPAAFQLVAAVNPCPCGFHGEPGDRCQCTPGQIRRYASKLSGPLLDRFDLLVRVAALDPAERLASTPRESSAAVRARVVAARSRQARRVRDGAPPSNGRLGPAELDRWAAWTSEARELAIRSARALDLSARALDRVRRVARTIADLADVDRLGPEHVAEALQYRCGGTSAQAERSV